MKMIRIVEIVTTDISARNIASGRKRVVESGMEREGTGPEGPGAIHFEAGFFSCFGFLFFLSFF
jgi:hypothetical protein